MKAPIQIDRLRDLLTYDRETGELRWRKWHGPKSLGSLAGTICEDHGNFYLVVKIDGKTCRGHRIIWALIHGEWPQEQIDHKDGNGLNNKPGNLRLATHGQNMVNRRWQKRSYPRGVSFDPRAARFYALGSLNGRRKYLGSFKTAEEASAKYESWARETYGEFYRDNGASA